MRDQWYGDNRDLLKWAELVTLARRHRVQTIVQIAMFRPNEPEWQRETRRFPPEVLEHFRKLENVHNLGLATSLEILVWKEPFCNRDTPANTQAALRADYFTDALRRLRGFENKKVIAFLDPDTGLAPQEAGPKHVKQDELKSVYEVLKPGNWLALYQHAPRVKQGDAWITKRRRQFARFLDLSASRAKRVKTFCALQVAGDVVLFAVEKTERRTR